MKHKILKVVLLSSTVMFGQRVLYDPHITAQEKRMVYAEWGNFLPNPKKFLGIQTKLSYAMTWGWGAPKQNERYRGGEDIRPLSLKGQQSQSILLTNGFSNQTDNMSLSADAVGSEAEAEYYYNTSVNYAVDPLYVLYYKKKLEPIKDWNPYEFLLKLRLKMSSDKMFSSLKLTESEANKVFASIVEGKGFEKYRDEMDILQENYDMAISLPMPRGKRIISYHELYIKQYKMYNSFINASLMMARIRGRMQRFDKSKDGTDQSKEKVLWGSDEPIDNITNFYNVAKNFSIKF